MKSNRRVQYLGAFAVSLAVLSNGAAFFWMTSNLPKFYNKEIMPDITISEISWLASIMPFGLVIGNLVASFVSDKFGRRTTLLASALPHIIGTVVVLSATKIWMLYVGRILTGCGVGMIISVSSIYLSEIADKEIRGFLTLITRAMFSVGMMIVLTTGSYVSYEILNMTLLAFPTCFFLACWWIPESPYYLLKEGKVVAAKAVILKLDGSKDEEIIEEKLSSMRAGVRKDMARSSSVKELLMGKQYRRACIIATGLRVTQLLAGVVPLQEYFGRLVQQSHCGINMSVAYITFGLVRFAGGLIAPLIVDRAGRRPLLLCSFFATSVVLAIVGVYFFMQKVIGIDNESTNPFRYTVFIGLIVSCSIANVGYNSLIFVIPAEIFPLNVKSIAITSQNIVAALLNFAVVRGYQIMEDSIELYGLFWFYAVMSFVGVLFTYFVIPETKGKSLREIQIELQGKYYDESTEKLNKLEVVSDNNKMLDSK